MSWDLIDIISIAPIIHDTLNPFEGEIPYMATGDLTNENSKEMEFVTYTNRPSRADLTAKTGDIVLARMKATNKVLLVNNHESSYIYSTGFLILRPTNGIDKKFLFHYLQSSNFQDNKDKFCTGATQKSINNQNFAKLKIPLPPLHIQKRISHILDIVDLLKRKDQQLLEKYSDLTQSIFIDLFGNPVNNEKKWELIPYSDLFHTRLGKMLDVKKQIGNKKYKYLGNSNVQWFRFKLDNLAEMEFNEKDIKTFNLKKKDILICEGGEVGRAAIWNEDINNVFFQKAIHRARIKTNNITPEYMVMVLWFYSKFGGFKNFVSTSTISHLTGEKLKTLLIPLPPYSKQVQYSQRIQSLNEQGKILEISLNHSINLFNTIFQKAFTGELVS